MGHFERFGQYTELRTIETARSCTLRTTAILTHCGEKRATHQAINENGNRVLLCRYCTSYVEAYQWAARMHYPLRGEAQIVALGYVWRSADGFMMPVVKEAPRSVRVLGMIQQTLESMVQGQLLQKIAGRYLLRDACPACFRRGAHGKNCGLEFESEQFAERRHAAL